MDWSIVRSLYFFCILESAQALACTRTTPNSCGLSFCNFQLSARSSCSFKWSNAANAPEVGFMCLTSMTDGTCESCPRGWTARGAFCVECDSLQSCDASGNQSCRGACKVGNYPTCEQFSKSVVCSKCTLDFAALASQNRIVTRGGILDDPTSCAAYFQCAVGYVLTQGSGQSLSCSPCSFPESTQTGKVFVSRGLTFGDVYSCMYASPPLNLTQNGVGQYGNPIKSCPPLTTSIPNSAVNISGCLKCPNPPKFGAFQSEPPECVPSCHDGYERRGEACISPNPICDREGYAIVDGYCEPQPLPWNPPGTFSQNLVSVAVSAKTTPLSALDEAGYYRVISATNKLSREAKADVCEGLVTVIPVVAYVQDIPLYTSKCGDVEFHSYYMLASGQKYVYAFLERSFGNNNRFVMWQVLRQSVGGLGNEGQVMQSWRLPGKVCSAVVTPGDVIYLYMCGSYAVSFVNASDYLGVAGLVYDIYTGGYWYMLKRQVHVLAGQSVEGNKDGMRDQAMFRGPISLAVTSDTRRLFVADRGNCRVAEVVVDYPGSFLTRVTTVGQSGCFSGPFPLPYPRLMSALPGGSVIVFVTDSGLVQIDALNRKFMSILPKNDYFSAIGEPQWIIIKNYGEVIELHTSTKTAVVTRISEACPQHSRSDRGGKCLSCPLNTYFESNQCKPCSNVTCAVNFTKVACTDLSDAKCRACTGNASYPFRFGKDCDVIPQYPCPPGYYGVSDCFACGAKLLSQLPAYGVCQCLGLPLTGSDKSCNLASPFSGPVGPFVAQDWVAQMSCTYDVENCTDRGCYLAHAVPRRCAPCPAGTVGVNGLWCERCSGFREPSPAQDSCVCKSPSYLSQDGLSCVCPPGYSGGGSQGCVVCPPGTVRDAPTVLPDAYSFFSGGSCTFCPPGFQPLPGQTGCVACEQGKYREGSMQSCQNCAGIAFAKDPTAGSSCTSCSAVCGPGKRWGVCPVNNLWFTCSDCPALASSKKLIEGGGNKECLWECVPGYYEFNGECWKCTKKTCPNGFKETPCTKYEDSHCRMPCVDEWKPDEHSVWLNDCNWDCEPGYAKIAKDFPGWWEYACVKTLDMGWGLDY